MISVPVRKLNTHVIPQHASEEHKPSGRWACRMLETAPAGKEKKAPAHHKLASEIKGSESASPLTSKGLFFKKDGKFDQDWMEKWRNWYRYIIAFTRKYFVGGSESNHISSRAESAKTAWAS